MKLGKIFFRNHFLGTRESVFLCVKFSDYFLFNLLASQGPGTKLDRIIWPERILPVGKHILRKILRYTS